MKISSELFTKKKATISALQRDRLPWWEFWRELANYYLPKRYIWLATSTETQQRQYLQNNQYILDSTGTNAAKILASGMMNGITSPSRPWFKLRLAGYGDDIDYQSRVWLDEVERRMQLVMAESNFYNCLAVMYLDLVIFGTASMLIYEDRESVIRCYNCALGEYYLGQSARQQVNLFAREFNYKVHQVVEQFGLENVSERVKNLYNRKGQHLQQDIQIVHLIEPNIGEPELGIPKGFPFRELYWEKSNNESMLLAARGYFELPGIFPRWETTANDSYGTSPGMEALGDVKQLQHESKKKGQALDFMVRPPVIADVQLSHRPMAMLPGGITFVNGMIANTGVGAKPVYQINPPIGEITLDIKEVQIRIREIFNNDLFRMISQLETVRSATEIAAREEEKLVQLGPVLERFENEALDPAINRIFNIMSRVGLIPPAPPHIQNAHLEIQYVSILSYAQTAAGAIPTEQFLTFIAQASQLSPDLRHLPNYLDLARDYARDIGVKAKGVNSKEVVQQLIESGRQMDAQRMAIEQGGALAAAAKDAGTVDVGGGLNAVQMLLGQ